MCIQVHSSSFSGGRDREPMVNRVRAVVELGTVVYSALDYRLVWPAVEGMDSMISFS